MNSEMSINGYWRQLKLWMCEELADTLQIREENDAGHTQLKTHDGMCVLHCILLYYSYNLSAGITLYLIFLDFVWLALAGAKRGFGRPHTIGKSPGSFFSGREDLFRVKSRIALQYVAFANWLQYLCRMDCRWLRLSSTDLWQVWSRGGVTGSFFQRRTPTEESQHSALQLEKAIYSPYRLLLVNHTSVEAWQPWKIMWFFK